MVCTSAEPELVLSPASGAVEEVGGIGSEAGDGPAPDDRLGVALCVIAAGTADGVGSLISLAAAGAITATKAAARTAMPPRRFPSHRGAATDATWAGGRWESAVTAVLAKLSLFEIAKCPATTGRLCEDREPVSPVVPTSAAPVKMRGAGTFASWSRNVAAVGRAAGSLLRAVINTSIKCPLTPGTGLIGRLATSTISSRAR